ncbi:SbcC/MukB-like Walker B domain-containing protein [uncultured Fusobacterium sp.]|uniref:SbcC/MukB-like Walker B domain-containing protein n=1 Tax=uncultured Fusobacterium sp. TaxID=159267 RepID=UPI0025CDE38C|nr:SbcC/MukB-like Walker B domain-containing protein [uncultured Fusobacterium sp.]
MNNRWKMNRIGFVNFWLYDEEIFELEDGKIFFRGGNGSGKSITTQSIISFLMDGDRSPERLDSFGGKDRKMEYYLLGDGEKEDETGYVFLEFRKGKTEQYLTIGIGQRAKKGSNLEFAGFCITDGKRVGKDIKLYREIGEKKVPLHLKKELPNTLGSENRIVYTQREYIDMINKNLFGFENVDQYKNLIKFLLKIRGAKLSKETKLTDIYKILNDSLPTLTDEDLRVLIDTMERIKRMEETNEEQKRVLELLKKLEKNYTIYNKNMLWKKYQRAVEQEKEYSLEKKYYEKEKRDLEKYRIEIKNNNENIERGVNRVEGIKSERKRLENNNLKKAVEELKENQEKKLIADKEIDKKKSRLEEENKKIDSYKIKDRNLKRDLENQRYKIEKNYKELGDINEILLLETPLTRKEIIFQNNYEEIIREVVNIFEIVVNKIEIAFSVLKEEEEIVKTLNICEEEYDRLNSNKNDIEKSYKIALEMEEKEKDDLIEKYYIIKNRNEFLKISKDELEKIVSFIKDFSTIKTPKNITDIFYKNYREKFEETELERRELVYKKEKRLKEQDEVLQKLESLRNQPESVPERSREKKECREALIKEGIKFIPLYEALDFSVELSEEEKKILEGQLKELGLIDILVIPYEEHERASKIISKYSDSILIPKEENSTKKSFEKFRIANVEKEYKKVVEDFLKNISTENGDFESKNLILKKNGYFKYGVTQGWVVGKEIEFIGAQNRRAKILKEIEELEVKLENFRREIEIYDSHIEGLKEELKRLELEYNELPTFRNIEQSISLRNEEQEKLRRVIEEFKLKEEQLEKIKGRKKEIELKVAHSCKTLNYRRDIESYKEVLEISKGYYKKILELKSLRGNYANIKESIESNQVIIEDKGSTIEDIWEELRRLEREQEKLRDNIKKIEEFLNLPENLEIGERLKSLIQEELRLQQEIENRKSNIIKRKVEIEKLSESIGNREQNLIILDELSKKAQYYLEEEKKLGLASLEGITGDEDYLRFTPGKLYEKVATRYGEYKGTLNYYNGVVEYIFEDEENFLRRRAVINFIYDGKKISLYEFKELLSEEIVTRESVLAENDRKLIEDILSGNVSHKLNVQIYEAKKWIEKTSENLQNLSNSERLKFAIGWLPKKSSDIEELNTLELQRLLIKDRELLTEEEIEKLSIHFRNKLSVIREEIKDGGRDYSEVIKEMLDYRKWFDFTIFYYKDGGNKKELTSNIFNKFSGGERAIAMYLPLLTAASAQYQKGREECPRMIALDEAFAGVDDKNIASVFEFIETLDFDYIMNSQNLWGAYDTVKRLKIVELIKNSENNMIITNNYIWDATKNKREFIL